MTAAAASARSETTGYSAYVLAVLFAVNCMATLDRSVINILAETIRKDLGLSDTQLSLITGLGFAFCYTMVGLPLARLADRGDRRAILAAGLAVWSAMTALTGRVTGFAGLLLARIGVGVGEASCYPTAYPLIGDYYPGHARPRAVAIFQTGSHVGLIVGGMLASLMAARYGWRSVFPVLGVMGLVLSAVVLFTVREPLRGAAESEGSREAAEAAAARQPIRVLWLLLAAVTVLGVALGVMTSWTLVLMMRVHHVSQMGLGVGVGPVFGGAAAGGVFLGGWLGSRCLAAVKTPRSPLLAPLVTLPLAAPSLLFMLMARGETAIVVAAGALGSFLMYCHTAPLVSVTLSAVPAARRGLVSALIVVGQSLVGTGAGSLLVGLLSDRLKPELAGAALPTAMLVAPAAVALGWVLVAAAYRAMRRQLV